MQKVRFYTTILLMTLCFQSIIMAEAPKFSANIFKNGTLVYSDDFDGAYNKKWWGGNRKDRKIEDGKLIIFPRFKTKDEAMKVLKRDHHLGLDPTVHLNKIPEKFVCHLRFKYVTDTDKKTGPVLQIGHHMISLAYLDGGGHSIAVPKGPRFTDKKSNMKINEWIDLIIEYELGKILISVNGHSKTIENKAVTIINPKDKHGPRFSFKHRIASPKSQIVFDYVRLWSVEE